MDRILLAFEGVPLSIDGGLLVFEGLSRELNSRTCNRPVLWGDATVGAFHRVSMDAEIRYPGGRARVPTSAGRLNNTAGRSACG